MAWTSTSDVTSFVTHDLAPLVTTLRAFQAPTGALVCDRATARSLLERVRAATHTALALVKADDAQRAAFDVDLDTWINALDLPPAFDHTVAAYAAPEPGQTTVLVAPLRAFGGAPPVGRYLECLLAVRQEPPELSVLPEAIPGCIPRSQSVRVLAGSRGIMLGSSLALFPEFVATRRLPSVQAWGLSYASKFPAVYTNRTLPAATAVVGQHPWTSACLGPDQLYPTRAIWAAVHDYYHEAGPRPLSTNLDIRRQWGVGVVDEVKADAMSAVAITSADMPYGMQIAESILLERLFRLPAEPGAFRSFDAAAGVLMAEWLIAHDAGLNERSGTPRIHVPECLDGLAVLGAELARTENETEASSEAYVRACADFVASWLAPGRGRARYGDPPGYARLVRPRLPSFDLLDFTRIPQ
jgi:Family of unknown function (DUF6421)